LGHGCSASVCAKLLKDMLKNVFFYRSQVKTKNSKQKGAFFCF
jgi:hypothetical protein